MYVNGMPVIQRVWPQHYYFVKVLQQISLPIYTPWCREVWGWFKCCLKMQHNDDPGCQHHKLLTMHLTLVLAVTWLWFSTTNHHFNIQHTRHSTKCSCHGLLTLWNFCSDGSLILVGNIVMWQDTSSSFLCVNFFSFKLQGEKDWQKYETARKLKVNSAYCAMYFLVFMILNLMTQLTAIINI